MGRVHHGLATTTVGVRRAIQQSQASLKSLTKRYENKTKTVVKGKKRFAPMGQFGVLFGDRCPRQRADRDTMTQGPLTQNC